MLSVLPEVANSADQIGPDPGRDLHDLPAPGSWSEADRSRVRWSVIGGLTIGFVPYLCVLWDFGLNPLRRASAHGFASNFYDLQARALLDGHLWVPDQSLGIEGFVVDGRTYMYFPPLPALLRVPVLLLTDRVDGRLSAPMMLLAWSVLAAATATLLWNARFVIRGRAPVSKAEAWISATFLAAVTGGSVIVFLAALPWVYHEAYLWATAWAVATLAGLIVYARCPTMRVAVATGVFAVATTLTRTTTGWTLAITVIVVGAICAVRHRASPGALVLVAGGIVAICCGAAFNWVKFRHPYMFPLEHQEWTNVSSRRRLALMMNGGTITGPRFLTSTLVNYFRPDGIRFTTFFPFVSLPAEPARSYGHAIIDQSYRTGSVLAFTPMLFVLGVGGFISAIWLRAVENVRGLMVPVVGAIAAGGGVMLYGYIAHRYTADFLPALVICGAIAVVTMARRVERSRPSVRRAIVVVLALSAAFGSFANGAAGVSTARSTWRGERLERLLSFRHGQGDIFGRADTLVVQSSTLPTDGVADQLHIVEDCQALYLATGDQYEPWVTVDVRDLVVSVEAGQGRLNAGILPLIRFDGPRIRNLSLETDSAGRVRFRVGEAYAFFATEWYEFEPPDRIVVTARVDTTLDRFNLVFDGIPESNWSVDACGRRRPAGSACDQAGIRIPLGGESVGRSVSTSRCSFGPRLQFCNQLRSDVG